MPMIAPWPVSVPQSGLRPAPAVRRADPSFGRRSQPSGDTFRPRSEKSLRSWVLGILLALGGGGTTLTNLPPANTVATARPSLVLGIPSPFPAAYLQSDGDVIAPLFRVKKGHITPDGQATGLFGVRKGRATSDGRIYETVFPVGNATWPLPSAVMKEGGAVYTWPLGLLPAGRIAAEEDVPTAQKAALGLWMLPEDDDDSSDERKSGNRSGR